MKKNIFWFLFILTALILAYQNCSSQSEPVGGEGRTETFPAQSSAALNQSEYLSLAFGPWNELDEFPHQVDLKTGVFLSETDNKCLLEQDHQRILEILDASKVCMERPSGEQYCTAQFVFPYANLEVVSNSEVLSWNLGEYRSGCDGDRLCGENDQTLKILLQSIAIESRWETCD